MQSPARILVINDFDTGGGAEVVYRTSIDILSAMPGLQVESFDGTKLGMRGSFGGRIWNFAAAKQLASLLDRFQPDHVWVHNYHNNLSSSILPVIARRRRRMGFKTYMTCHDYFLVFYDPGMAYRSHGQITPVPVRDLGSLRALLKCSSAKGPIHDAFKKLHRHVIQQFVDPRATFDMIFCPSVFMQNVLAGQGFENTFPNAVIAGAITIGAHAVIGSGSVVNADVLPWAVVAGNPAKILRIRDPKSKPSHPADAPSVGGLAGDPTPADM